MSPLFVPPRSRRAEWMDRSGNSLEDLEGALADIAIVNWRLGGARVLLDAVRPLLRSSRDDRPFEILDVGTGGADLALALLRAARAEEVEARVAAIEIDPATAAVARRREEAGLRVVRADAFRLPFRDGQFDLVCVSLFLHHFPEEDGARLLRGLARVCRGVILVNDLAFEAHFLNDNPFETAYWHDRKQLGWGNNAFVDGHVAYQRATRNQPDFQRGNGWSFIYNDR